MIEHWAEPFFSLRIVRVTALKKTGHNLDLLRLEDNSQWVCKKFARENWLGKTDYPELILCERMATLVSELLGISSAACNSVLSLKDGFAVIRPYIKGKIRQQFSLAASTLSGSILARIHGLDAEKKFDLTGGKFFPSPVLPAGLPSPEWLLEAHAECLSAWSCQREQYLLSHRDLHAGNFVWVDSHTVQLLDWESAGLIHPFVELIGLACNCAGIAQASFDPRKFLAALEGYKAITGKLPEAEEPLWALIWHSWLLWYDYTARQGKRQEVENILQILVLMKEQQKLMKELYKSVSGNRIL